MSDKEHYESGFFYPYELSLQERKESTVFHYERVSEDRREEKAKKKLKLSSY